MAVRLSTLAEVKTFSLASFIRDRGQELTDATKQDILDAIESIRTTLPDGSPEILSAKRNAIIGETGEPMFKTVGLARQIRIDEDFGTQNIYGIGSPTRPRIVPNNYAVNVTAERLQLDTRSLSDFMSTPEFWYADYVQNAIGIDDFLLYTYFFVRSKEKPNAKYDIYALMPRSSSTAITSGDVMIANNVNLVGFKYSYDEAFFDLTNMLNETITGTVVNDTGTIQRGV